MSYKLYNSQQAISEGLRETLVKKQKRLKKSGLENSSLKSRILKTINKESLNHSYHIENRGRELRRVGRTDEPEKDFHENFELLTTAWEYVQGQDFSTLNPRLLVELNSILEHGSYGVRNQNARVSASKVPRPNPQKLDYLLNEAFDIANHLSPIDQALFLHQRLLFLHPFEDGNGRSVRLYSNAVLNANCFPPIMIPESERSFYFDMLEDSFLSQLERINSGNKNLERELSKEESRFYGYLGTKLNTAFDDVIDYLDKHQITKIFPQFNGKDDAGHYVTLRNRLKSVIARNGLDVTVTYKKSTGGENRHLIIKGSLPKQVLKTVLDSSEYLSDFKIEY